MNTAAFSGWKFNGKDLQKVEDILTVEESLKITVNGAPFTVTMRTPGNEKELVRGLLFTENVYTEIGTDLNMIVQKKTEAGHITSVDVIIPKDKIGPGLASHRSLMSVSSCGICGKEELDEIIVRDRDVNDNKKLDPVVILQMFKRMSSAQDTFRKSGGSHASAAFTNEGEMLTIQEDIGRHNAVDKVVGSLVLQNKLTNASCMTVSGRISYEIVNKCYAAGIRFLAAVSAPSSMAVEMSERLGITLMAFCREDKLTAYSHVDQLVPHLSELGIR